jgi:TolB protein
MNNFRHQKRSPCIGPACLTAHGAAAVLAIAVFVPWTVARTASAQDRAVRLTTDGSFKQRPAWSPDGKHLAFAHHEGAAILLYLADVELERGRSDEPQSNTPLSQGGTRERAARRSAPITLVNVRRLTDRDAPEYDAVWSPDGKRLAFTLVKQSGTQGDLDVYTIAADGTDLKPFATTGEKLSHEESPAWSPDGKRIAFSSTREGNQEIFLAPCPLVEEEPGRRQTGTPLRLTNDPSLDTHPAFSPDGSRIVFATARWGDLEIAVMDADGSNLIRLTNSAGLDDYPVFSPDGRHIAFTSNRDGNFEIYLMAPDGTNPHNLTNNPALDNFPAWHRTTGDLLFLSNRSAGFDLYLMPVAP